MWWVILFELFNKKDANGEDYSWIFGYLLVMAFVLIVGGGLLWWIIKGFIITFF